MRILSAAVFSLAVMSVQPLAAQPLLSGATAVNYSGAPFSVSVVSAMTDSGQMKLALDVRADSSVAAPVVRFRVFAKDGSCKGSRAFERRMELSTLSDTWTFTLANVAETDLVLVVPDLHRPRTEDFLARAEIRDIVARMFNKERIPVMDAACRTTCLHFNQDCQYYCANLEVPAAYCTTCTAGSSDPNFNCEGELECVCFPYGPGSHCPL